MRVSEIMNKDYHYISSTTTLVEAANKMDELNCGFLPIGNDETKTLEGVITDRDIVTRAIAKGLDPSEIRVTDIKSPRIYYCYEDDTIEKAAENMQEQHIYRLVVLNNDTDKNISGIISLNDIAYAAGEKGQAIAGSASEGISHH